MSWVRIAPGHAKSSARTAAAPAPSRVDEVDVVDYLNAGVGMGSADEGGTKADGDAAGGLSPTANGTPGAGAAVETAKEIAQTIANAATLQAEAEVEARPRRTMQALVVMLGREDGAAPKSAGAVALLGGKGGLAPGDLVHRGMVNTGNYCFRNLVLQALLACEPFVRREFPLFFFFSCFLFVCAFHIPLLFYPHV